MKKMIPPPSMIFILGFSATLFLGWEIPFWEPILPVVYSVTSMAGVCFITDRYHRWWVNKIQE